MKATTLSVQTREGTGSSSVRKLRAQGMLPGIIYGKGIDTQQLAVPRYDFIRLLHAHGTHALVSLKIAGGGDYLALIKEVAIDPVRLEALHVDFHRVEENKPVHTEVEVTIVGDAPGVKTGGVLDLHTRSLSIEALPRSIPEAIEFDVSSLELGDVARVGDIQAPEGVTILTDAEETLVTVVTPRAEEPLTTVAAEGEEAGDEAAAGETAGGEAEDGAA
ncbi:MAG TPA: 50S ribosomal protein L25 [Actinomycetota bacterium]|nr:50S ribosomal protein L25 [Actinomycetota bacterium]